MSAHGRECGFTLIELLVALCILAMAMVIVPSTLKLANRAMSTTARLSEVDDRRLQLEFVGRQIGEALPVMSADGEGKLKIAFAGDNRGIRFVAPLADGPEGGGVYGFEFSLVKDDATSGGVLVMRVFPRQASAVDGSPVATGEERRISLGRQAATFRYFGVAQGKTDPEWLEAWDRPDRMPDLVEITFGETVLLRAEPRSRLRS